MPLSTQPQPTEYKRTGYRGQDTPQGPERWKRARVSYAKNPNTAGAKLFAQRTDATNWVLDLFKEVFPNWSDTDHLFAIQSRDGYSAHSPFKTKYYVCSVECACYQLQLDGQGYAKDVTLTGDGPEITKLVLQALGGNMDPGGLFLWNTHGNFFYHRIVQLAPIRGANCRVCGDKIPGVDDMNQRQENYAYLDLKPMFDKIAEWGTVDDGLEDEEVLEALEPTPTDKPEGITLAVDGDGRVIDLSSVYVVTLTERELTLFYNAAPTDKAFFAKAYGRPVGE